MNTETKKILIFKLGENLPFLRRKLDLTQEDLANKIGVSRITINTIEKTKNMTWGRFTSIMMVLACNQEMCRLLRQLEIYHPELNTLFSKNKNNVNDESLFTGSKFTLVKQFAEYVPSAFYVFRADENQEILFFNQLLVDYTGYETKDEFLRGIKGSFMCLCHPDDIKNTLDLRRINDLNKDGNRHITHRIVDKNKKVRWFDTYFKYVDLEKVGPSFFAFSVDITDRVTRRISTQLSRIDRKNESQLFGLKESEANTFIKKRFEGTRVLLADGNRNALEMNKKILEHEGAIVTIAETGKQAVSAAKKGNFNIVLIDAIMPVLSGVETIKAITKYYKKMGLNVPVIVTTSVETDLYLGEPLKAGAFECLYKPVHPNELATIIIEYARKTETVMKSKLQDVERSANTDPLTKVKSSTAYAKDIEELNKQLKENPGTMNVAVAVCDCDNLKGINDTYGHAAGDRYIQNCCKLICEAFSHSPVYRVGGDEFFVIIQNKDLKEHQYLMKKLEQDVIASRQIKEVDSGRASLSIGLAIYDRRIDTDLKDTAKRADTEMYKMKNQNKEELWKTLLHDRG